MTVIVSARRHGRSRSSTGSELELFAASAGGDVIPRGATKLRSCGWTGASTLVVSLRGEHQGSSRSDDTISRFARLDLCPIKLVKPTHRDAVEVEVEVEVELEVEGEASRTGDVSVPAARWCSQGRRSEAGV